MNKIHLLDESTINKIAAGEVIERPFSVVKELVENSLDANSKKIIVKVKDGGKKQICVIDDGEGIGRDDLDLCIKKHATSKIKKVEDIFGVFTYGFRGEALATISEVAKTEIISATIEGDMSYRIVIEDGKIILRDALSKRVGTTINVSNLFYNIPARQKFLKSSSYELNKIINWLKVIAIVNEGVQFSFYSDDKLVFDYDSRDNRLDRISQIYDLNLKDAYYNGDFKLAIYFSTPSDTFHIASFKQAVFINNRYVKNDSISFAIVKAFEDKIPRGKKPNAFIFLDVDPNNLDINVHPQKLEVRLRDDNRIFSAIVNTINNKLSDRFLDYKNDLKSMPSYNQNNSNLNIIKELSNEYNLKSDLDEKLSQKEREFNNFTERFSQTKLISEDTFSKSNVTRDYKVIGQFLDSYIIVETINGRLLIIDQHVAEERYYFEQFFNEFENSKKLKSQNLLTPIVLEFKQDEIKKIHLSLEDLKLVGFDIDIIGQAEVAIRQIPVLFDKIPDVNFLRDMIINFVFKNSDFDERVENIIATMSCKASIKANTPLSISYMYLVVDKFYKTKSPYTCPHGRPIAIEFSRSDLEKMVGRI